MSNKSISIHAPRTGSDIVFCASYCNKWHFNPRSPHGERRECLGAEILDSQFQSTLPARGATAALLSAVSALVFQSTLPARGATCLISAAFGAQLAFQSTLPARGATLLNLWRCLRYPISIHAPRTGSDFSGKVIYQHILISIHAPRTGSDGLSPVKL